MQKLKSWIFTRVSSFLPFKSVYKINKQLRENWQLSKLYRKQKHVHKTKKSLIGSATWETKKFLPITLSNDQFQNTLNSSLRFFASNTKHFLVKVTWPDKWSFLEDFIFSHFRSFAWVKLDTTNRIQTFPRKLRERERERKREREKERERERERERKREREREYDKSAIDSFLFLLQLRTQ